MEFALVNNLNLSDLLTVMPLGQRLIQRGQEQLNAQLHCVLLEIGILARRKLLLTLLHCGDGLDHKNVRKYVRLGTVNQNWLPFLATFKNSGF